MQVLFCRGFCDHLIHKLQELLSSLQLRDGGFDLASRYFQCCEKIKRSVTLIGAFETANDFAIVGFNVAGLSLQSLDAGLLIDRDHQGFLRGIEIQTHNVSRLDGELFVCADAPRTLPLQADSLMAKHSPDGMHRALERGRYRRTIPAGLACRRRLFQEREHLVAELRAVKRFGSRPRCVHQSGQPALCEALPPFNDGIRAGVTGVGHFLNSLASQTAQDNLSSFDHLFRFGPTSGQPLQLLPVLGTTSNGRGISCHGWHHTIYRVSLQVSTRVRCNRTVPRRCSRFAELTWFTTSSADSTGHEFPSGPQRSRRRDGERK